MKILHQQLTMVKILFWLILYSTSSVSFAEHADYLHELESEASQKTKKNKVSAENITVKTKKSSSKAGKEKQSDYLDGLSAEADDTHVDTSSAISTKELKKKSSTKKIEPWNIYSQNLSGLRPGLKWKEFETVLKNSYFASYVFYKRLNPTSKSLVFKSYENKANIKQIRAKIISLSR